MSAVYYDTALLEKIKKWINDPNMTITGPNETTRLFRYLGDKKNDTPIELPLIALRRAPTLNILSTAKKPLSFDGWKNNRTSTKITQLNGIPISINYFLDIYTKNFEEAEEYIRNFVFNFINFPRLTIIIPYNEANIEHSSNVRINSEIEDNSDIPERMVPGQFTRKTIGLYIDDAYLFDYRTRDTISIETETEVELDKNVNIEN